MTESSPHDLGKPEGPSEARRILLGVAAGGGLLAVLLLILAGVAIATGLVSRSDTGRPDLGPWLVFEIIAGTLAGWLSGGMSRRIARSPRGPGYLALGVLSVGCTEAAVLLRYLESGGAHAPAWMVISAPFLLACGILLGGTQWGPVIRRLRLRGAPAGLMNPLRYLLPLVVLSAAAALSVWILPDLGTGTESVVVASALTLDFTLVFPGLVYLLLVRARRVPWLVLVPAFAAGYALALAVLPEQNRHLLDSLWLLVVPAELLLVGYLVILARRAFANAGSPTGDFASRFRTTARKVLGSRIPADILTTEVAILYYAFHRSRPEPSTQASFTVHRGVAYGSVVVGLVVVLFAEMIAVHLLVSQWSTLAAWILTGLSAYACVWLLGDYRAMGARPIRVTPAHILVRVGLRWEVDIPRADIENVALLKSQEKPLRGATLVASLVGQPNLRLTLRTPSEITGMYGLRKVVKEIWLTVDGAEKLVEALRSQEVE